VEERKKKGMMRKRSAVRKGGRKEGKEEGQVEVDFPLDSKQSRREER